MDFSKIKSIEELRKFGKVNTENPGLAILTLQNGDNYYFFYDKKNGSPKIIKELNSEKKFKTKTHMHKTPKGGKGYSFTVDSTYADININRKRYVIIPESNEIIEVFSNWQPNPEPESTFYHIMSYGKEKRGIFICPDKSGKYHCLKENKGVMEYENRGKEFNVRTYNTQKYYMKEITDFWNPRHVIIEAKDSGEKTEINNIFELRQFRDSIKNEDPELAGQIERILRDFYNISEKKCTDFQELKAKNLSVDISTIPGIAVVTRFDKEFMQRGKKSRNPGDSWFLDPGPNARNVTKYYFIDSETGKATYITGDEASDVLGAHLIHSDQGYSGTIDTHDHGYCHVLPSPNPHYVVFAGTEEYNPHDVFEANPRITLAFPENKIIERGLRLTGKNLRIFEMQSGSSTSRFVFDLTGRRRHDSIDESHFRLDNRELTVAFVTRYQQQVPIYAYCDEGEFLNGADLKKYVTQLEENALSSSKNIEETLEVLKQLDRITRWFDDRYMEEDCYPAIPTDVSRIEQEVHLADLLRKRNLYKQKMEKAEQELSDFGVKIEGEEK